MRRHMGWVVLLLVLGGCTPPPAPASPMPTTVLAAAATATPTSPPTLTAPPVVATVALPPATAVASATRITFDNLPDTAVQQSAVALGVPLTVVEPANTAIWQLAADTLVHPIALEQTAVAAYLIDGGRLLRLAADGAMLTTLLSPGDVVDGVTVIELLDATAVADAVLVLDRAGDVYRYDVSTQAWSVLRYDRPVGQSSGHYFVALAAAGNGRFLLEGTYGYVQRFGDAAHLWPLPQAFAVDVAADDAQQFVLLQALDGRSGQLLRYAETRLVGEVGAAVAWQDVRQVAVTETAVYVLDMAGRRLTQLDKVSGDVSQMWQLPADTVSFALSEQEALVLAGRDRLYVMGQSGSRTVEADAEAVVTAARLAALPPMIAPIAGTGLTQRLLQMPGAPRHYRLGVHEGVDFYWGRGTAVRAVADGVVVRALVGYERPSSATFDYWRQQSQLLGYTSPEALDFYRGMQVWVDHGGGVVTHYAHLSAIDPAIGEGTAVVQGQLLGAVGNSGSPASVESETADAHLHFEIWIDGRYLGQFLRPVETIFWLQKLLSLPPY